MPALIITPVSSHHANPQSLVTSQCCTTLSGRKTPLGSTLRSQKPRNFGRWKSKVAVLCLLEKVSFVSLFISVMFRSLSSLSLSQPGACFPCRAVHLLTIAYSAPTTSITPFNHDSYECVCVCVTVLHDSYSDASCHNI